MDDESARIAKLIQLSATKDPKPGPVTNELDADSQKVDVIVDTTMERPATSTKPPSVSHVMALTSNDYPAGAVVWGTPVTQVYSRNF